MGNIGHLPMAILILVGAFIPSSARAGTPRYRYGDTWWQEYKDDKQTILLLHFGRPTATARDKLVTALQVDKDGDITDDDLADIDELEDEGPTLLHESAEDAMSEGAVDDADVPQGTVLDYSSGRQRLRLDAGLRTSGGGRFGNGLVCDGSGALPVIVNDPRCIECWFKVDRLPPRESCVFSVARDESRVLLRPDGRLELRLKKPHGIPDPKRTNEGALALITNKKAGIVSRHPIRPGAWVHVAIYNKPHPTPGGGEPWDARLKVDGTDVAWYLSERYNNYHHFMGRGRTEIVVANTAGGDVPFAGTIDEFRVSSTVRGHYERPPMPWRDAGATRPLQFDRPYFRNDGTLFHASLDAGTTLDIDRGRAGKIALATGRHGAGGLAVEGVRGKGWVMDPEIGFARFPADGLDVAEGALEFWLRPVNFDDMTGYWHHSPPRQMNLTVARLMGTDPQDGSTKPLMRVTLPRAFNLERSRIPLDPGHWLHIAVVWDHTDLERATLYVNGQRRGHAWRAPPVVQGRAKTRYVELGVSSDVTVKRRESPVIEIDEVVGYTRALRGDEVRQARARCMGKLEPIELYDVELAFKYSIQKLTFSLLPLLAEGVEATACEVRLTRSGRPYLGPFRTRLTGKRFTAVMSESKTIPYGDYRAEFEVKDGAGRVVAAGTRDWKYREEPWRNYAGGVLQRVPSPWTPVRVDGSSVATRMTSYGLGAGGLPTAIRVDGADILSGPVRITEDGAALRGGGMRMVDTKQTHATWTARYTGRTCDIEVSCRAEYDGMIRHELKIEPKGRVAPLALTIPLKAEYATRYLCYPMGERGVTTGEVGAADGKVLESRVPKAPYDVWRAYQAAKKRDPALTWERHWEPIKRRTERYGFFGHVDINDMNRGLWWFADNATGWTQSKTLSAIEIVRSGDSVSLVLNLVPEKTAYSWKKPVVFGILPHPARPMPKHYRLFERAAAPGEARTLSTFDAFRPWPMDPRDNMMHLFPRADPDAPDAGPSWEYARRCVPNMKLSKPDGYRTLYLSKAWFSCRAGAYDNWEWRSGDSSTCALTPSFVNYLCWEMNDWIGRGIFDAIYLDECYEHPARNREAGMSVLLPDGTEQPGVTNFQFRELMKRWRNLFHEHGLAPMVMAHHTYSWQYHGLVFCDAYLDGENAPIVSLRSGDWIDSTSRHRFEVIQNGSLWGMASFYMPFTAEGGFENKEKSQFPRWQWRMARQAQSLFAHYEVATTYEGQGADVYKTYWRDVIRWGGGDTRVTFHPYWNNAEYLTVEGGSDSTPVSFYKKDGKILLAVSNRGHTPATVRIALRPGALGLGRRRRASDWDSSYAPPKGDDYVAPRYAASAPQADRGAEVLVGIDDDDDDGDMDLADALELDGQAEVAARASEESAPRFDGATLVLPVRGRDFRLVSVE